MRDPAEAMAPRPRQRGQRGQRGFTLIEVVLALTIMSVAMALIFQAFSTGYKSWEKGLDVVEKEQRVRTVLHLISAQIRSAYLPESVKKDSTAKWFAGGEGFVTFITALPYGVNKKEGLFYVRYFLEKDSGRKAGALKMLQRPFYAGYFDEEARGRAMVLLPEVFDTVFEFSNGGRWSDKWPGDGPVDTLRAVRLSFKVREGKKMVEKKNIFILFAGNEAQRGL